MERPACLLLHGLTASPRQLSPLTEALEAAGSLVRAPLLPGHGTSVAELARTGWRDWYAAARTELVAAGRTVDVIGLSMGALLALRLAMEEPALVRRVVCLSPAIRLPFWMRALLATVRYSPLRWAIPNWPKNYAYAVKDLEGRAIYQASSYGQFPVPAVIEFVKLQRVVMDGLGRITAPTLVIHPHHDFTAAPKGATLITEHVVGPAELIWLEHSYHVSTLDLERDLVCQKVLAFLRPQQ